MPSRPSTAASKSRSYDRSGSVALGCWTATSSAAAGSAASAVWPRNPRNARTRSTKRDRTLMPEPPLSRAARDRRQFLLRAIPGLAVDLRAVGARVVDLRKPDADLRDHDLVRAGFT